MNKFFVAALAVWCSLITGSVYAQTATSGSQAGSQSIAGVADNGDHSSGVSMDSHAVTRVNEFLPVQVSPLPATVAMAGANLVKVRDCGWQVADFEDLDLQTYTPQIFGLFQTSHKVKTMAGIYNGLNTKNPLTKIEAEFEGHHLVSYTGHVLYMLIGVGSQGGGSSGALNHAASEMWGGGLALNSNSANPTATMVAVTCEYNLPPASKAPQKECVAKRDGDGFKKDDVIMIDAAKKFPSVCGG